MEQQIFCSGGCGASITVQAEDASSITYTCARCAPQDKNADAIGVPRKNVPAEVREYVNRSGASAPNDTPLIPREREIEEVETSGGTKEVKPRAESDPDDVTVDDIETEKVERVVTNTPSPDRPRIPRYLKTVPSTVIRTSNPDAPYGLDDDGKPIREMRSDVQIMQDMFSSWTRPRRLSEEEQEQLKQKIEQQQQEKQRQQQQILDTKIERLAHLKEFAGMKGVPAEASSMTGWGAERKDAIRPKSLATVSEESYRALGLTRQQLVWLLKARIGEEIIAYRDKTKPKTKTLLPRAPVEAQVRGSTRYIGEMKGEIKKLDEEIARHETTRHGLSKPVMKRERHPDDIPNDADLKKFRREIDDDIAKLKAEQDALKEKIAAEKKQVKELQERLDNWELRPENYVEEYPLATYSLAILFGDIFKAPKEDNFKGRVPPGYNYNEDAVGAFRQLVFEFGEHKDAEDIFKHWRRFEKAVVAQVYAYLKSKKLVIDEDESQEAYGNEDVQSDPGGVVKKTGGAAIGGRVYGGGTDWDGKPRVLSSFDRSIAFGGGSEGGGGGGDDHTEAQGSDDDEPMNPS